MAAHAAVPARRRHVSTHGWAGPIVIGVLYGLYAETNARDGGPLALSQLWIGLVSAVVLAVAIHTLRRHDRALPRVPRAAAWGALVGVSLGYAYSLTDASVLSSSGLGLVSALVTAVCAHYFFYTHEDATSRPAPRRTAPHRALSHRTVSHRTG
ncbi:hypothetical protein [Streptomyces sp. cmx-10-25]|uniref:hypothetical protein n=1 Tax=Streptomyces sp. cmx-10-25 TaxID=2790919 RepID=UPI00397EE30C